VNRGQHLPEETTIAPLTGEFSNSESHPQSSIQPLPTEVVYHIAAGEVIDSLAAAVRELIENALDARASHVALSLWPDRGQVRVADNGNGMTPENLSQAATPHSTSKIRGQQDLSKIHSLGFRGEALHSLARLGHLEICSRPQAAQQGWRATYSTQGQMVECLPSALAPGTIVTVHHLFGQSTRRHRLPSLSRQLKQVQQVIYHSALCHPQVTWTLDLNDKAWFSISPGTTPRPLVPQMVKSIAEGDLRESTVEVASGSTLYTLIGLPDRCHRPRLDWVKIAVNGRLVAIPELEQRIVQAFRYTLPRHRYPLGFLHLRVPPHHIDWNRSVDKGTIYLEGVEQWGDYIEATIADLLRHTVQDQGHRGHQQRVTQLIKAAEQGGAYQPQINLSDPLPRANGLKAIGQVHNRYILAEQADGVCLIEQHIAHERVLYERLKARWEIVNLDSPVILERLTKRQIEQLQRLGLAVDPFGNNLWAVRQAPVALAQRDDLPDALLELSLGGDLDTAQVAIACRTAIRNGTPLDLEAMQTLLNAWQQTRNPRTCPHGRPICLTLEESSLARFFRRHWVIGKSHGV
jgi:DNA mismatch repair protein MutL